MKKRICSLLLTAALMFTLLPGRTVVTAAEADLTMPLSSAILTGKAMAAVNTELSSTSKISGSFSSGQETHAPVLNVTGIEEDSGLSDIIIDPETGEERRIRSLTFPELTAAEEPTLFNNLQQAQAASHYVGEARNIRDNNNSSRSVRCLYSGIYCTVWGATADASSVCITTSIAQGIANAFDSYYPSIVSSFGEWYDADGDGKLAIFCYDIDKESVTGLGSSYTAGFFRPSDLIDSTGHIGSFNFGTGNYIGMELDCIHLDTYPAMGGSSNKLGNVSQVYSTLVHEAQHLISFSNQIIHDQYNGQMETWLNEAFSMAAEHMICGSSTTSSRITYFNDSASYKTGAALTYWDGSLSNYANSYLFGQYIRTRYGTKTGTDGGTIFKTVLNAWQNQGGGDTLAIIAGLLDTTPKQLVKDFWAAVYLKEAGGPYGFRGESWANRITPAIYSISSSTATGIYNGGAKFFTLPAAGYTVTNQTNLEFVRFSADGGLEKEGPPVVSDLSALRTAVDKALLTLQSSKAGFLWYATSKTPITEKAALTNVEALSRGANTLNLTVTGDSSDGITLYYCTEGADGSASEIRELAIPACPPPVFIESGEGGSLQLSFSGISVESGNLVPIGALVTVTVTSFDGYAFSHLTVNGERVDGFTFTMPDAASVTVQGVFVPVANFVTGGICGENVWWYLTDENTDGTGETLTVYGQGAIQDVYYTAVPWYDYRGSITNIIVQSGVTGIGNHAFYDCSMTNVSLPETVTTIGKYAFYSCGSLQRVVIPSGVTVISEQAFNDCYSLTEAILPDGIKEIEYSAFSGCSKLASVRLPESLISIGSSAFRDCSKLTEITIPNGVSTIDMNTFSNCSRLARVFLPQSITLIDIYAFAQCSKLTDVFFFGTQTQWDSIDIDSSNTAITKAKLHLISASQLVTPAVIQPEGGTITVPNVLVRGETVTVTAAPAAKNYVFSHLLVNGERVDGLIFTVPNEGTVTVTAVFTAIPNFVDGGSCGDQVRWYLTDENADGIGETLTVYGIGKMKNLTYTSDMPWYSYRSSITSVILESGVTSIGDRILAGCTALTSITIPEGVISLGTYAFDGCTGLQSVVLPQSLTAIGMYAFQNCEKLQGVELSQNLGVMENGVFYNCTSLKSIVLPGGIGSVSQYCFWNCTGLESVILSAGIKKIPYSAFSGCSSLKEVILPQGFTTFGSFAFSNCRNLRSIIIPDSVTTIETLAFSYAGLTDVYYTGTQTQWDGISITETGNEPLINATLHLISISDLVTPVVVRPEGGTVELSGLWIKGETISVSVTPAAENYAFRHILVNGQPVDGLSFTVPDAQTVTVTAVFEKLYDVILTVTQPTGGSMTLSKEKALFGETITAAITPNPGYEFAYLLVNGIRHDGLTFLVPEAETVTVSAMFSKDGFMTHTTPDSTGFTVTAAQFREDAAVGFLALYSMDGRMLGMVERELPRGQDAAFPVDLSALVEEAASCRMFFAVGGTLVPITEYIPIDLPQEPHGSIRDVLPFPGTVGNCEL